MINPGSIAFDIDGVVADTMTLFIDIARNDYNITNLKYDDITCYMLEDCLDIDTDILYEILTKLIDGTYTVPLKPMNGACEVLSRLGTRDNPVLFVTARPYPGPIQDWLEKKLFFDPASFELIATGSFDSKADILLKKDVSFFVEDRLETCFFLEKSGVTPILFKQPWNRDEHPFKEVNNWQELEAMIEF